MATDRLFDLAVVGTGPAGLTASVTAAEAGLDVVVLDLGERIGGQYWRHTELDADAGRVGPSHHGWGSFSRLRTRFNRCVTAGRITYLARHNVWSLEREDELCRVRATSDEREQRPCSVCSRSVIVATGAHDRHVPFPGWTLPGVMAGGGAQSLLKGSGVAAGRKAVVAGTGPFLLPVAEGLLAAGVDVLEVVEPNAPWRMLRQAQAIPGGALKLAEALGYLKHLARDRIRFSTGHAVIAAHGEDRLRSVTIARVDANWCAVQGTQRDVRCDLLTVGYGFTPQIELPLAAGCATAVGADGSLVIAADAAGRTSIPGIYAAGETTGVGGAELARIEGHMCGVAVIEDLLRPGGARHIGPAAGPAANARTLSGRFPSPRSALPHARRRLLELRRHSLEAFAEALHSVFSIEPGWQSWLDAETVICRCEEVPYVRVRTALDELGAGDARTVKLLARPGMGRCQGRICGSAIAALAMAKRRTDDGELEADLVAMSRRMIGSPIPLSHLAAMGQPADGPG